MNNVNRVQVDRPLIYIGYKYNYHKILGFISTERDCINVPSETYFSH